MKHSLLLILQVRYPDDEHDFPPDVRIEAYRLIDRVLNFQPDLDDCLMPPNPGTVTLTYNSTDHGTVT